MKVLFNIVAVLLVWQITSPARPRTTTLVRIYSTWMFVCAGMLRGQQNSKSDSVWVSLLLRKQINSLRLQQLAFIASADHHNWHRISLRVPLSVCPSVCPCQGSVGGRPMAFDGGSVTSPDLCRPIATRQHCMTIVQAAFYSLPANTLGPRCRLMQ